jgi:thiol-disulfide isomerase/thioredoxin
MRNLGLIILVAVVGLALGAGYAWISRPAPPPVGVSGAGLGDPRPPFRHGALDGQWVEADQFDGQLLLVNFWATWCAPCRREMPVLQAASERHEDTLAVVGIAIDDPGPVRDFVEELGISYPILVGSADVISTQRAWGNAAGALPYTVLVDRDGVIRWQHLGEVTADELDEVLAAWL